MCRRCGTCGMTKIGQPCMSPVRWDTWRLHVQYNRRRGCSADYYYYYYSSRSSRRSHRRWLDAIALLCESVWTYADVVVVRWFVTETTTAQVDSVGRSTGLAAAYDDDDCVSSMEEQIIVVDEMDAILHAKNICCTVKRRCISPVSMDMPK